MGGFDRSYAVTAIRVEFVATSFGRGMTTSAVSSCRSWKSRSNIQSPDDWTQHRPLLIVVAYTAALEICDCTNLESLQYILHIDTSRNPSR
jgi:hypothetical protein